MPRKAKVKHMLRNGAEDRYSKKGILDSKKEIKRQKERERTSGSTNDAEPEQTDR